MREAIAPPFPSAEWTERERLEYIEFVSAMLMRRLEYNIERHQTVPFVSRDASYALWHCINAVASWPAEKLEDNRAALMKFFPTPDEPEIFFMDPERPEAGLFTKRSR